MYLRKGLAVGLPISNLIVFSISKEEKDQEDEEEAEGGGATNNRTAIFYSFSRVAELVSEQ